MKKIPLEEFKRRQVEAQRKIKKRKLDGLRWETGTRITSTGVEAFSDKFRKIIEVG